jgi:hypothetical protein
LENLQNFQDYTFSKEQITIHREEVLKALQVPINSSDSYVDGLISEFTQKSLELCSPCARYGLFKNPVFIDNKDLVIENFTFYLEKILASSIKKSSSIIFFISTVGSQVEQLSKQLIKDGHLLEGLIVDIIASEIAEEVARLIYERIKVDMEKKGLKITNRYSPGYCNWPVSDQQKLFSLFKNETCGVHLTESSLMVPIKSVSGIIGVGPNVKYQEYFCDKCKMDSCIYRDSKGKT